MGEDEIMAYLEKLNSFLSGSVLPVLLILTGLYLGCRLKFFYLLHPLKLFKTLKEAGRGEGTSPFKALSMALAGTLGVGNISGVAAAITAGGAGAVFWMWVSAFAAMGIKYAEVYLAVLYRKAERKGTDIIYRGGAPYYIKEGLSKITGKKTAGAIGAFFALLLVSNSLMTGNIVQINAAASAVPKISPVMVGIIIGAVVLAVVAGGVSRIGDFTVRVIPFLSVLYIVLSIYIILSNIREVPAVFEKIFSEAFSLRSAGSGLLGYGIMRAVRFGVTRGIFSNEAGSGTAPTAHASANTKSPHHQGCFGIFEVFADTIILCTMTAFVVLLAKMKFPRLTSGLDGIPLSVRAYGAFCGSVGSWTIAISVVIFALATIICQSFYGIEALDFFGGKKRRRVLYILVSFIATVIGSVISSNLMWHLADLQISLMTAVNTLIVFVLSDEVIRGETFRKVSPHPFKTFERGEGEG
ncbi:MAG: sodium:alanine symporter family protein [Ruminococcaceae bacterium]|nr:sodium:alanine symporter family protein [Oscillospiraceae bacterium]